MTNNTKQLISNVSTFYEQAYKGYHINLSKYVQWIDSTRRSKSMAFPLREESHRHKYEIRQEVWQGEIEHTGQNKKAKECTKMEPLHGRILDYIW